MTDPLHHCTTTEPRNTEIIRSKESHANIPTLRAIFPASPLYGPTGTDPIYDAAGAIAKYELNVLTIPVVGGFMMEDAPVVRDFSGAPSIEERKGLIGTANGGGKPLNPWSPNPSSPATGVDPTTIPDIDVTLVPRGTGNYSRPGHRSAAAPTDVSTVTTDEHLAADEIHLNHLVKLTLGSHLSRTSR